jgi:thioredoxin reductase (NADPH)
MSEVHNVVIIGSGPSGWTAALYLARANMKPLVFAGEKSGGQLMLTTVIENFPGFPEGIDGPQLMMNMRQQAIHFGTDVKDINVTAVDLTSNPKKIVAGGMEYLAKAVLISTGAETMWLGVPGEQQFIGRGVSSCAVCDAAFFRGKNTFVVGGGDAAMEDALALTRFASSVTMVHRRDSFRASKIMQERVLGNEKVKVMWNSGIVEIKGDSKVTGLVIEDLNDHSTREVDADGVFVAIGHKPATEIFRDKILLDEKGFVVTRLSLGKLSLEEASKHIDEKGFVAYPMMTTIEGVFGAGDCVDFRYKQAITAAGLGTMAALDIEKWLEEQS